MGKNRVEAQSSSDRIAGISGTAAAIGTGTVSAASTTSSTKKAPVTTVTDDAHNMVTPVGTELTDAAEFNLTEWTYDPHDTTCGLPFQVFDHIGETLRGKLVLGYFGDWDPTREGDNNVRTQIDTGLTVANYQDGITWDFFDFHAKVGFNGNGEARGYFPFTAAQQTVAYQSIAYWDDIVSTDFQRVDVNWHDVRLWAKGLAPDILLANTTSGPAQAWAYYPSGDGHNVFSRIGSDVWIGADGSNYANLWDGGYGQTTQVHELGHTLGLSHPGDYNFGDDNDGDGIPDPITYVGDAFYFQDDRQYTTMSYFDSYEVGSNYIDWNLMRFMYAATPMVDDIWILQQKYGVETTTRTGNTTYGFNASEDQGVSSAMSFHDGEQMTIFTIWDAAGNDTIDLSGYYTPSVIDLREGAYSSAGGWNAYGDAPVADPTTMTKEAYLTYVNANNAELGMPARGNPTSTTPGLWENYFLGTDATDGVSWLEVVGNDLLMENNIGIAYGAVIENAIGGHGDDRINGNWATNYLTGNGGADTFVIFDNTGTNAVGVERVDTRHDYITDFDATEGDRIDLCEFANVTQDNVQYIGGDLLIDTDGNGIADFTVTLLGSPSLSLADDIVYHADMI